MSQTNDGSVENGTPTGEPTMNEQNESLFNEGFAFGDDNSGSGETGLQGGQSEEVHQPQTDPNQQTTEQPKVAEFPPAYSATESPYGVPQGGPAPATAPAPDPAPVKTVEAPEEITAELETLKKLNPDAAVLALEDSPEGASIRARLEQYGAELAQDRAERVLWQRQQEQQRRQAENDRAAQTRDAHNAAFMSTLQRDHPDYMSMLNTPARRAEAAQYQQSVFAWISAKPYAEAAQLMEVARSGRDPVQVSALLTKFESERGGRPKQPDPTGALVVPGRGAPVAPTGVGDKDDFDAGWNANLSK